jgi:hypothetical protein
MSIFFFQDDVLTWRIIFHPCGLFPGDDAWTFTLRSKCPIQAVERTRD